VVSNEIEIDQIRRWSFEGILQGTRVYRKKEANDTDASFTTSIGRAHAWSIFSGLSLADISELSVIALPLFCEDLTNRISFHDSESRAHHLPDPGLHFNARISLRFAQGRQKILLVVIATGGDRVNEFLVPPCQKPPAPSHLPVRPVYACFL
jgi:hypothetical protein